MLKAWSCLCWIGIRVAVSNLVKPMLKMRATCDMSWLKTTFFTVRGVGVGGSG